MASNEDPKDPEENRWDKGREVAGDQLRGIRQKKMEEKRPLNGRKKNEGSGTNLDRSEGCRGARTGMTRRMHRAKKTPWRVRALEEKADTDRTFRRNRVPKGGRAGLNRPRDPTS